MTASPNQEELELKNISVPLTGRDGALHQDFVIVVPAGAAVVVGVVARLEGGVSLYHVREESYVPNGQPQRVHLDMKKVKLSERVRQ